MRQILPNLLMISALATTSGLSGSESSLPRREIVEIVDRIANQQELIEQDIERLRSLLGMSSEMSTLQPRKVHSGLSQRVRMRTEDGMGAFADGEYRRAKEAFQMAWEQAPNDYITNYN